MTGVDDSGSSDERGFGCVGGMVDLGFWFVCNLESDRRKEERFGVWGYIK